MADSWLKYFNELSACNAGGWLSEHGLAIFISLRFLKWHGLLYGLSLAVYYLSCTYESL